MGEGETRGGPDWRQLLELSPLAAAALRLADGAVLHANRRYAGLAGDDVGAELVDRLDGHDRLDADMRLDGADGGRLWCRVSLDRLEVAGEPAVLAWIEDIGARRRADEDLRKLSRAIECSPATVLVTDARGVVEYVNPAFTASTGISAAEAVGASPALWKSGRTPLATYHALWAAMAEGREWHGEFLNRRRDGGVYWEYANIAPVLDGTGQITHFVAVKVDITAIKAAENRAEAEAAARAELLAVMSHEVRTPLTAALGMTRLLLDTKLSARQREYLEVMRTANETLLGTVDHILDFSRLESGGLELETAPFDPVALAEGVVTLMGFRAAEKGLALDLSVAPGMPARVLGDSGRLRQVLLNLVGNAVKFTERGGVRVSVEPAGPGRLRLTVADTGIGIAAKALPRLFERYAQADASVARRFGGSGLGLAICKRIVDLAGGTITVDSRPGAGSRFQVTLPLPDDGGPAPVAVAAAQPLRLLLVEDNLFNQMLARALLEQAGHTVTVAADGATAVELARRGGFDLALMDVHLPGMNGFEATRAIRALPGEAGRLPIVAMTADTLTSDRERCLAAGMDDFLAKPLRAEAMLSILARLAPARV